MKSRDLADLVLLAALWGASFLFMRVSTVRSKHLSAVTGLISGLGTVFAF